MNERLGHQEGNSTVMSTYTDEGRERSMNRDEDVGTTANGTAFQYIMSFPNRTGIILNKPSLDICYPLPNIPFSLGRKMEMDATR